MGFWLNFMGFLTTCLYYIGQKPHCQDFYRLEGNCNRIVISYFFMLLLYIGAQYDIM